MCNTETNSPSPTVTKSALIAAIEFITDAENWAGHSQGRLSPSLLVDVMGSPPLFDVVDLLRQNFARPRQIGGLWLRWDVDSYLLDIRRIH